MDGAQGKMVIILSAAAGTAPFVAAGAFTFWAMEVLVSENTFSRVLPL